MHRFTRVALASSVAILAATACSSNASPKSSVAITTATATPTGKPIKLTLIGSNLITADSAIGAQAAADAINAAGGVKGRPIQIVTCNDNLDANTAAQCARTAVADPDELAMVGNIGGFGNAIDPIAEQAGMASIGNSFASDSDWTSPISFPLQGGGLVVNAGRVTMCKQVLGAHQIGMATVDVPNASDPALMNAMTKSLALPNIINVSVPLTAADLSAPVAAVGHTDCIIAQLTTAMTSSFIKTARQEGVATPIVVGSTTYSPQTINEQLGASVQGVYLALLTNPFSAGYKEMTAAVAKYDPSQTNLVTTGSAQAWLGVHVVAYVAGKIKGDITRQAVLDGLRHLAGYDTKGLTISPLDYTVKSTALGGQYPNLYPSVTGLWPVAYRNGTMVLVNQGKPVNTFG